MPTVLASVWHGMCSLDVMANPWTDKGVQAGNQKINKKKKKSKKTNDNKQCCFDDLPLIQPPLDSK